MQHHPLEADVEYACALGDHLAERREHQRRAGENGAPDQRRERSLGERAGGSDQTHHAFTSRERRRTVLRPGR